MQTSARPLGIGDSSARAGAAISKTPAESTCRACPASRSADDTVASERQNEPAANEAKGTSDNGCESPRLGNGLRMELSKMLEPRERRLA